MILTSLMLFPLLSFCFYLNLNCSNICPNYSESVIMDSQRKSPTFQPKNGVLPGCFDLNSDLKLKSSVSVQKIGKNCDISKNGQSSCSKNIEKKNDNMFCNSVCSNIPDPHVQYTADSNNSLKGSTNFNDLFPKSINKHKGVNSSSSQLCSDFSNTSLFKPVESCGNDEYILLKDKTVSKTGNKIDLNACIGNVDIRSKKMLSGTSSTKLSSYNSPSVNNVNKFNIDSSNLMNTNDTNNIKKNDGDVDIIDDGNTKEKKIGIDVKDKSEYNSDVKFPNNQDVNLNGLLNALNSDKSNNNEQKNNTNRDEPRIYSHCCCETRSY